MHIWKLRKYLHGLQLFMVAIRTNLFATPSLRVGADAGKDRRGMMGMD